MNFIETLFSITVLYKHGITLIIFGKMRDLDLMLLADIFWETFSNPRKVC